MGNLEDLSLPLLSRRLDALEERLNMLELPTDERLAVKIDAAIRNLPPAVIRIGYTFGEDHSGDQAFFFRILLADAQSDQIMELAREARNVLAAADLRGRFAYYSFRTESEQKELKEPEWEAQRR